MLCVHMCVCAVVGRPFFFISRHRKACSMEGMQEHTVHKNISAAPEEHTILYLGSMRGGGGLGLRGVMVFLGRRPHHEPTIQCCRTSL